MDHCITEHDWGRYECSNSNCSYEGYNMPEIYRHEKTFHEKPDNVVHAGEQPMIRCVRPNCLYYMYGNVKHILDCHYRYHDNVQIWCPFCPWNAIEWDVKSQYGTKLYHHFQDHLRSKLVISDEAQRTTDLYSILERTDEKANIDLETTDWILHPSRTIYCAHDAAWKTAGHSCDFSADVSANCMEDHCNSTHKYKDTKCDFANCDYVGFNSKNCLQHKNMFHCKQKKQGGCNRCPYDGCDYTTEIVRDFLVHTNVHQNITTKCLFCPWRAARGTKHLEKHLRRHLRIPNFKCTECPLKYYAVNVLHDHVKREHGRSDSHKYQCSKCFKNYPTKRALNIHMKRSSCKNTVMSEEHHNNRPNEDQSI